MFLKNLSIVYFYLNEVGHLISHILLSRDFVLGCHLKNLVLQIKIIFKKLN